MAEVKKYNQIERPIQDELDRIDSELHDTSIATDDIGVRIPFGRIMPGGGGINYDYVYVGGKKLTPPAKTTNFLKVYLDGTTTPEWVSAMPETQDSNAEVFDVTKNRIHLAANFGGG